MSTANRRATRSTGGRGFTLIEVLIAVALAGIVLAASYAVFFAAQEAVARVSGRLERTLETQKALDRLRREIEAIYLEGGTRADTELTFLRVENREQFGSDRGRLAFTTLDPGKGLVLRYEYRVVKGNLVKRGGGVGPDATAIDVPYLEDVESFRVEALENGRWLPAWDTRVERRMPEAIQVSLLPAEGDAALTVVGRPRRNRPL